MAAAQGKKTRVSDGVARDRLLKSATLLFTRKGYAGATVREIVAAAGVTKPVLYYYFRNKEGIYLELMRGGFSRFDSLLEEIGRAHLNSRHITVSYAVFCLKKQ